MMKHPLTYFGAFFLLTIIISLMLTLLGRELCAEAILWLAGDRSGRTTGHVIPVDGGLPEAFLR